MISKYFYGVLLVVFSMCTQAAYFPIALSTNTLNVDLSTKTNGSVYSPYMSGNQTFGGIPFSMVTDANGENVIHNTTTTINTNLYGATTVYTLINSFYGKSGVTIGSIKFNASDGTNYTVNLVEGVNVRDHYIGSFVNTTSASYVTLNVIGTNTNNTAHLDMQAFALPASFSTRTLTSIVFTTTNSNGGEPFLAGVTANATNMKPIAYYAMDEASWNGTSNEVSDTAGYAGGPFNGQGIGTPTPTATYTSPARAGSSGTCGYAVFGGSANGGGAFTLDNLPIDLTDKAKTSVSFWMYWDGSDGVMPIGWGLYDLWFRGGTFGFNTDNSDVYGINSSTLSNGWHHVVAVFTNGGVTSNKLYIDNVSQTISSQIGSQINANAIVQSTLQVGGYTKTTLWRFKSQIDEVKIYNGEVTQTQVSLDYNATHSCPNYNVIPSNFNCTFVGGAASTGHLYTQVASSSFNVDVIALKSTGAVETSYVASGTKNVTLEFVDGSGATACASRAVLSPVVSQTVTFASTDAGRKTVSNITIAKAYRDLMCRVTDANQSPSVVGCSTDDFAVRPSSLSVTSSANADSAGTSTSLAPIVKAGASFTLAAGSGVVGYDGAPLFDTTKLNAHTGATQAGTLGGSFSAANATTGTATGSAFNYSEVGYFRLAANGVYDSTFTAVDSANGDCVSGFVGSGGKYGCSFGNTATTNYFGRFIPDHFSLTTGSTTPACSTSAVTSDRFTYLGQDGFTTSFTLVAQNSSNQTTQNYVGSFAKFALNTWANYTFKANGLPVGTRLTASSTAPTGTWSNGTSSVVAKHIVTRPSAPVAGGSISISTTPTDSDGVTMPLTYVSSSSLFRYGRLWVPNTYGSELLPLSVPIEAQYWNGTSYQRNQLDICSVITAASIIMDSYKANLTACETQIGYSSRTGTFVNGLSKYLRLTKPGAGNNGSVDLTLNLNAASGSTCNTASPSAATAAGMSWFGSNPVSRATFGIYKTPIIYMRENF